MYLYVSKHEGLEKVPEALLSMFGQPKHVMDLMIKEGKKLARVDAEEVVADIKTKGFFLQMPPSEETEVQAQKARVEKP